jgi:hypothetical protein
VPILRGFQNAPEWLDLDEVLKDEPVEPVEMDHAEKDRSGLG